MAALLMICGGCQTMTPDWSKLWWGPSSPKVNESKYPTPVKMAAIWSPAVFNQVGQQSVRGLGGRLYFYDAKNRPVAVEGQLVVFAYDETQPDNTSRPPTRKFAFTPEQFTQHYSPTELGASYSIWIPWDPVGQPQVDVTLAPIFTASSGHLVVGEMSRNLLPGPTTQLSQSQVNRMVLPPSPVIRAESSSTRPEYAVVQAAFQEATAQVASQQQAPGRMETLSLTLPDTMADQLANASPQIGPMERLAMQRTMLTAGRLAAAERAGAAAPTIAAPRAAAGVTLPGPAIQPQARYALPSPQAPSGPALQPAVGPPQTQQFPGAQPFAPPATR